MKWLVFIIFFFVFSARYALAQYVANEKEQEKIAAAAEDYDKSEKDSREKPVELKNKLCPVDLTKITPTPESPAIYSGDEWLSGSEFRPPKERRNYSGKKPRDLSRGVFTAGDKFTYAYKGKIYRFSSSESIEEFKKDPEKYLKEWEKKERFRRINVIND